MNGQGTLQDPFIIETADDYRQLFTNNNANHYVLGNDLNLTGYNISSFNSTRNFNGSIDGKGFTVKNGSISIGSNISMLPQLMGATAKNIRFENCSLVSASDATTRFMGLIGAIRNGAYVENIEAVNCTFDSGIQATQACSIRNLLNGSTVKNMRFENVHVKGGASGIGFIGQVDSTVTFNDSVFTGSLSDYNPSAKSDGIFTHEGDGSLFFYKVYVLDKNLPSFDRSKGCATYVTDAQLKDPMQIPLGNAWSHSDGSYPTLKVFSGDTGKQVTVRKTITAKKSTIFRRTSKQKTRTRSVTAKGATVKTRSLRYSTRAFVSAKKATFTVNTYKIKSMRVRANFDLGKATTNYKLLRHVIGSFQINLGRVTVHSNVIYPSLGNVPVYAYTGIITGRSNTECRTTQSSIYRIL